jgi:2-iminobutanoate/2-iminopropanoate deaminase
VKRVITPAGSNPVGAFSPGIAFGNWVFLAGQGGFDPATGKLISDDIGEQTEQTFRNIEALLEAAGASLDDVVSCLVHLTDLAEFPSFNAAYERQFPNVKPVRTTVEAGLLAGMRVEITVIARTA